MRFSYPRGSASRTAGGASLPRWRTSQKKYRRVRCWTNDAKLRREIFTRQTTGNAMNDPIRLQTVARKTDRRFHSIREGIRLWHRKHTCLRNARKKERRSVKPAATPDSNCDQTYAAGWMAPGLLYLRGSQPTRSRGSHVQDPLASRETRGWAALVSTTCCPVCQGAATAQKKCRESLSRE